MGWRGVTVKEAWSRVVGCMWGSLRKLSKSILKQGRVKAQIDRGGTEGLTTRSPIKILIVRLALVGISPVDTSLQNIKARNTIFCGAN